jgi:hypothetical protein
MPGTIDVTYLRPICVFTFWLAAATTTVAAAFNVPTPEPRRSPKVERISSDDMIEICGFSEQDTPFFLDSEYRRAIKDYTDQISSAPDINAPAIERLIQLRSVMEECRENDANKRSAKRAMRSCKDLVREHKAASARAEYMAQLEGTPRHIMEAWGERFWPPLQKCLDSMRCRLDNKRDMEDALAVYHEVVDEMTGWLLDVKGAESMKICGATIRDLKKWCKTDVSTAGNTTAVSDVCVDPRSIANMINWVQSIRPRVFPKTPAPGGTITAGGQP